MRLDILQKKKYDEKSVGDSCVVNFTWNDLLFKDAWQSYSKISQETICIAFDEKVVTSSSERQQSAFLGTK